MDSRPEFQINSGRFSAGMAIMAPSSFVWRIITDTSLWPLWGLSVVDVTCSNRFILYGIKGSVKTIMGFSLNFTITHLEKEREWTWAFGGINATGHSIIPINDGSCMLFFDMPIWAIPYSVICLIALNRIKRLVTSIKNKGFDLDDFTN